MTTEQETEPENNNKPVEVMMEEAPPNPHLPFRDFLIVPR